jgi:hypothetical protein
MAGIPTKFDGQLAEIENAASGIMTLLRTMNWAAAREVPGMRTRLREMLQNYVDAVMKTAPDGK